LLKTSKHREILEDFALLRYCHGLAHDSFRHRFPAPVPPFEDSAPPLASSGSNGCAQHGAKLSVTLYVPLATHGFTAGFAAFGIEQNPFPPSRRLGADSRIVLPEAPFPVGRPADIGSAIIFASASQHINEKEYLVL
jgi:hypothetical protein